MRAELALLGEKVPYASFIRALQHVVVYQKIIAEIGELALHVSEESADEGSEMNDVRRLVSIEHCLCLCHFSIVCQL